MCEERNVARITTTRRRDVQLSVGDLIVRRSHRITAVVFSLPIIPTQLHPDLLLYTETGSHVARRRSFHGSGVTYAANR